MNEEHDEWVKMFNLMCEKFSLTNEEMNKQEYRIVFKAIERWAYFDRLRRQALRDEGNEFADDKGVFWKGEEEN